MIVNKDFHNFSKCINLSVKINDSIQLMYSLELNLGSKVLTEMLKE